MPALHNAHSLRDEARAARTRDWVTALTQLVRDGKPIPDTTRLDAVRRFIEDGLLGTTEPLLPMLLNLKGSPYSLEGHFPFAPIFRTQLPKRLSILAGRQVSKSTSLAAAGLVFSNVVPHTTTLYVTPLFEQIRRFSTNYVGDFIDQSPIKPLLIGTGTNKNVLQRSFKNASKMIFSFALLNADRIRGITADICSFDEIQDMNHNHIPIIEETMSYSDWGISRFTGTPKTLDNTAEKYWSLSSQAEWFVPCYACGAQNIPAVEHHLLAMIGPWREDISEHQPGTICHRCRRPVNPRYGRWVHRHPDRRQQFAGYHIPQLIMPRHYGRPDKWAELLVKQESLAPHVFHNEVLGTSYDSGSKLVTLTELQRAAVLPWANNPQEPAAPVWERLADYRMLALGVDWGGGGKEGVSYTTLALLGLLPGGVIDVLWGRRLLTPHDHMLEAHAIRAELARFHPSVLAHDYTGAGALRETFLIQSGVPLSGIMPVHYVRSASHNILNHVPATISHPRAHWQADKTRSLLYTTSALKTGLVRTFQYDRKDDRPGLLDDFLALIDEKVETSAAGGIYVIKRQEGFSDDFAHAVNLGCLALWHACDAWPDFAAATGFANLTTGQLLAALGPQEDDSEPLMGGYFMQPALG